MERKNFIKTSALTVFSISTFGVIHWNGAKFLGDKPTTTDILGPFYRPGSPLRSNLIPVNATGEILNLYGTIYKKDGKTPLSNSLIEIWHCDPEGKYDNTSDKFLYRGSFKTDKGGKYQFRTHLPVPYEVGTGQMRPAHIHFRISHDTHQDLITQIYFSGDKYIETDNFASTEEAKRRILTLEKNPNGELSIKFDVVMQKEFEIDHAALKKVEGTYDLGERTAEFIKIGDLLYLKINGQLLEALSYKGENTFAGAFNVVRAKFELDENRADKVHLTIGTKREKNLTDLMVFEGEKQSN